MCSSWALIVCYLFLLMPWLISVDETKVQQRGRLQSLYQRPTRCLTQNVSRTQSNCMTVLSCVYIAVPPVLLATKLWFFAIITISAVARTPAAGSWEAAGGQLTGHSSCSVVWRELFWSCWAVFMTRMRKEGTYPDVCALLQPKFYGTKGCMPPKKVVSRTKKRKIHFNRWGSRKRTLFIGTEISSLVLYSPCRVPSIIYRHTYLSLLFLFTLFTFFLPFTAKFLCTVYFSEWPFGFWWIQYHNHTNSQPYFLLE